MDDVACYCSNARRAALALTARYDGALAPHGLKVTQFSLLHAVKRSGAANLTELSDATGLDRSTLGRNLTVLERLGLVALQDADDARHRRVALTGEGRTRLRAATATWKEVQATLAAAVGAELEAFVATARRLAALGPGPSSAEVA
jgi:DNA-binding MarR family transcriptional regulator